MNKTVDFQNCKRVCFFGCIVVGLSIIPTACNKSTSPVEKDYEYTDTKIITSWFDLSLELVKGTPGFTPPVSSRAFGYLGIGLYESMVQSLPDRESLEGRLNGLSNIPDPEFGPKYVWSAVANAALAKLNRELFRSTSPNLNQNIDDLENMINYELRLRYRSDEIDRSIKYGQLIAESINDWSKTDGGYEGFTNNFPDDYKLPAGPGMWVPTPPGYLTALQPKWGNNRLFTLTSIDECPVTQPPDYSEIPGSAFYDEALEVYETVLHLSEDQREIALFWSDDPGVTFTPPGHWISILNQVLSTNSYSTDVAVEAYARLGIALAEAFIVCWHEKYKYNLIRPISYIQQVIDTSWNTSEITDPVITPPFPEYPSGHSVQSGAAAEVLTELLGTVSFTDRSYENGGLPARSYSSFWEAAVEAAISRLYGGIHYRSSIQFGIEHGRCIGKRVNEIEL